MSDRDKESSNAVKSVTNATISPDNLDNCSDEKFKKSPKDPKTPVGSYGSKTVLIAPLVLLSVADHYGRAAKGLKRRVVGVLLGQDEGNSVRVTNSFAVPFEEDEKDHTVWFLDHNYIESMRDMFKKVNAREKLVGWYHTGPKLRASDLEIHELFRRYANNPLLVIIDVQPREVGVPTDAYFSIEEMNEDTKSTTKTFVHTPSVIKAEEAEEIGVEHLLRDIRDVAVGTLSTRLTSQLQSLQGLHVRLHEIEKYLQKVISHKLPVNHVILGTLQDIFNLLPKLTTPKITGRSESSSIGSGAFGSTTAASGDLSSLDNKELAHAMAIKTNDQLMLIYLSSLIRAINAFHDLIENKIHNRKQQEEANLLVGIRETRRIIHPPPSAGQDKDKSNDDVYDSTSSTSDEDKPDSSDSTSSSVSSSSSSRQSRDSPRLSQGQ